MITEELIKKINILSKKSKEKGLTEEEKVEQKNLREQYVKLFKNNLEEQLKNIKIEKKEF